MLEGEFDASIPLINRLKTNIIRLENENEQDFFLIECLPIDLYSMYHSILSYLTPFEQTLFKRLDQLEIIINYKFNNQLILLEASTHGTFHNPLCSSYEKLEYLGDIKLGKSGSYKITVKKLTFLFELASVLSDYSFGDPTKTLLAK
jgi:hypothetical protein